jgi:hypothetical protein
MDKATFWATKSPLAEYHAVVFDHPSFESPIRIVANQFASVTLAGNEYLPAPMTIKPPEQSADARVRLQIGFPRAVVGQEFKRRLLQVTGAGVQNPITVTYSVYLGVTDAPQLTWELYVSDANGVAFGRETVQVTATDSNPMRRACAPIYDPSVFTGLEIL